MTIPSANALTATLCDFKLQKLKGVLDIERYTTCERPHQDLNPLPATHTLFVITKPSTSFPATICKATEVVLTIQTFLYFSSDTIPSKSPKTLTKADCHTMKRTLNCFGHKMQRIPNTDSYKYEALPEKKWWWLTTVENKVVNCFLEPTSLTQEQKNSQIMSIVSS